MIRMEETDRKDERVVNPPVDSLPLHCQGWKGV